MGLSTWGRWPPSGISRMIAKGSSHCSLCIKSKITKWKHVKHCTWSKWSDLVLLVSYTSSSSSSFYFAGKWSQIIRYKLAHVFQITKIENISSPRPLKIKKVWERRSCKMLIMNWSFVSWKLSSTRGTHSSFYESHHKNLLQTQTNLIETITVKEKFKTDQYLLVADNPILLTADD